MLLLPILDCDCVQGMSCQQFQALPPEHRSAEDAAMLHAVQQKQWKRCPDCRHVVERIEGCNHMRCRCNCHFCYACGARYVSDKPSANNAHGTQACSCDLFQVPGEPARAHAPAVAVVLQEVRKAVSNTQHSNTTQHTAQHNTKHTPQHNNKQSTKRSFCHSS